MFQSSKFSVYDHVYKGQSPESSDSLVKEKAPWENIQYFVYNSQKHVPSRGWLRGCLCRGIFIKT